MLAILVSIMVATRVKAYYMIADMMTWQSNSNKTQAAITRDVQEGLPHLTIHPNIWNKRLSGPIKRKIHERIKCTSLGSVDLKDCDTLAKLKKRIKVEQQKKAGIRTFKTEITVSREAIVIGKTVHPIIRRKAKDKTYPCIRVAIENRDCWIRADALAAALLE